MLHNKGRLTGESMGVLCLQARNVAAEIKTGIRLCPNDSEPGRISGLGIIFSRYCSKSCSFTCCNFSFTSPFHCPQCTIAEYEDNTSFSLLLATVDISVNCPSARTGHLGLSRRNTLVTCGERTEPILSTHYQSLL
jgi:hypothetical protein